uniref:Uncharacterized protein n=1 Tax=Anguilla anguilla TaxID=7936 RepID=A0A0E9Q041_ANGAN
MLIPLVLAFGATLTGLRTVLSLLEVSF